jgi:DNA-binding PucR family transcriptional regulator
MVEPKPVTFHDEILTDLPGYREIVLLGNLANLLDQPVKQLDLFWIDIDSILTPDHVNVLDSLYPFRNRDNPHVVKRIDLVLLAEVGHIRGVAIVLLGPHSTLPLVLSSSHE